MLYHWVQKGRLSSGSVEVLGTFNKLVTADAATIDKLKAARATPLALPLASRPIPASPLAPTAASPPLGRVRLLEISLRILYRKSYRCDSVSKIRMRVQNGRKRHVAGFIVAIR